MSDLIVLRMGGFLCLFGSPPWVLLDSLVGASEAGVMDPSSPESLLSCLALSHQSTFRQARGTFVPASVIDVLQSLATQKS